MKKSALLKLGIIALFSGTVALGLSNASVLSQGQTPRLVELILEAQKQVIVKDESGQEKLSWQSVGNGAVVEPGDILLYQVRGQKSLNKPVKNLTILQEIPAPTTYILNSAQVSSKNDNQISNKAKLSYSIDGGKTFSENPTITIINAQGKEEIKPAPAEVYTHLRYGFSEPVVPADITISYQLKVK